MKYVLRAALSMLVSAILFLPPAAQAQQVTILHSFKDGSVTNDGAAPAGVPIQGSDGNLYGVTSSGGSAGNGTVYRMTPAGQVTILHSFRNGSVANDGSYPQSIIQAVNGYFYGVTSLGGSVGHGTVFQMSPTGEVTILHSFGGGSVNNDGQNPVGPLLQLKAGLFIGTTQLGGSAGEGTIFEISIDGKVVIEHSFGDGTVANDGKRPQGIIVGPDGFLYGGTYRGGSAGNGVVYKATPSGRVTTLHSFGVGYNDGRDCFRPLVEGADGSLYGTTYWGGIGADFYGTVFKITPSGKETVLHAFSAGRTIPNHGIYPVTSVMQAKDGNFYGTVQFGGFGFEHGKPPTYNGHGTIFKMTPAGELTILHYFKDGSVANDGADPVEGLFQAKDGYLYGVTKTGGSAREGVVYRVTLPAKLPHGHRRR